MGCNSSKTVQVQNTNGSPSKKTMQRRKTNYDLIFASTESYQSEADSNYMYNTIFNKVTAIKCPPTIVPILCMSNESVPIIITNNDDSEVNLPIIAMSSSGLGRVFCFGSIQMIAPPLIENEGTAQFYRNLIKYILRNESYMTPALLLELNPKYESDVMKLFNGRVSIEKGTFKNKFERYKFIIMTHDITVSSETNAILRNYVENGGTLIIFYDPQNLLVNDDLNDSEIDSELLINELLIDFDLVYYPSDQALRFSSIWTAQVPSVHQICRCTFEKLSCHYKEMLNDGDLMTEKLDEVVNMLRHYIISSNENYGAILARIFDASMEHLKKSNYRNGNELFPEVSQTIIAVVVQDIYTKLPASMMHVNPDVDLFPSFDDSIQLSELTVHLFLKSHSIISTGFWCPPGKTVHVSCKTKIDLTGASIQIGSHQAQLYMHQSPWHRWPSVVSLFPLFNRIYEENQENIEVDIFSPFGGMIYVSINDAFASVADAPPLSKQPSDQEFDDNENKMIADSALNASFTFSKVCRYPRVVKGNPTVLAQTKDIPLDWAEAESSYIILTLPSRLLVDNNNIVDVLNKLDSIIVKLNKFMSYNIIRPYRVVFDVDTFDEAGISYPINMSIEDAEKIVNFSTTKVTPSLFNMIKNIAFLSLRDQVFDTETELALSALAAITVLSATYPKFAYKDLDNIEMPFLFKEFWKLHKQSPFLFSEVMKESQLLEESELPNDVNDEKWAKFVKDLCRIGKWNYATFFQDVRPLPRNFAEQT